MAARLLPFTSSSLPSTSSALVESVASSTSSSIPLSGASKRQSDVIARSAPKRQKLQVQREEVTRTEKTKVTKICSRRGLDGFLYVCNTCKKTFKWRLRCISHAKKCGVEKSAKKKRKVSQRKLHCNICEFVSTTRSTLKKHRLSEHGTLFRSHRCTRCCKQFASMRSYVRHVQRHATSAFFTCTTIGSGLPV